MARVYSLALLRAHAISGSVTFTAPDGFTTVIRDIDWFVSTSIEVNGACYVYGPVGQTWDYHELGPNSASAFQWRGRMVLAAGEVVTFVSAALIGQTTDVT